MLLSVTRRLGEGGSRVVCLGIIEWRVVQGRGADANLGELYAVVSTQHRIPKRSDGVWTGFHVSVSAKVLTDDG
jgi:hypothetical protein